VIFGSAGDGRVEWLFTDRHGGTSAAPYDSANLGGHVGDDPGAVAANRTVLAERLGVPPGSVRYMDQVHGDTVVVLGDATTRLPAGGTDALVTAAPGVAVAVLVADCVPVLLADPDAGVVAAVHAGRPGVRNGVALRALDAMVELGADPVRTTAWLGPSVCPACYEVPDEMRADVASVAPAAWSTSRTGTAALDLRAGLSELLAGRGVTVDRVGPCTAESPDHYSYRRDGTTGRFAGVVRVAP
jgi:YfiH family protein